MRDYGEHNCRNLWDKAVWDDFQVKWNFEELNIQNCSSVCPILARLLAVSDNWYKESYSVLHLSLCFFSLVFKMSENSTCYYGSKNLFSDKHFFLFLDHSTICSIFFDFTCITLFWTRIFIRSLKPNNSIDLILYKIQFLHSHHKKHDSYHESCLPLPFHLLGHSQGRFILLIK